MTDGDGSIGSAGRNSRLWILFLLGMAALSYDPLLFTSSCECSVCACVFVYILH
jgi:hypothetical protein